MLDVSQQTEQSVLAAVCKVIRDEACEWCKLPIMKLRGISTVFPLSNPLYLCFPLSVHDNVAHTLKHTQNQRLYKLLLPVCLVQFVKIMTINLSHSV